MQRYLVSLLVVAITVVAGAILLSKFGDAAATAAGFGSDASQDNPWAPLRNVVLGAAMSVVACFAFCVVAATLRSTLPPRERGDEQESKDDIDTPRTPHDGPPGPATLHPDPPSADEGDDDDYYNPRPPSTPGDKLTTV